MRRRPMQPAVSALRRPPRAAWGVLVLSLMGLPAVGDVFHLDSGGTVEGQLLAVEEEQYRIRTVVGIVRLPVSAVERVEPAASPFEEYEQRRTQLSDTPAEHVQLATWCDEQGLRAEREHHLRRAVELDSNCAFARRGLGHVRIGELWVDGRTVVQRRQKADPDPEEAESGGPEQLAEAIENQWQRRIRAIKRALLDSSLERLVKQGREHIRAISDPLAILPLSRVLGRGDVSCRRLLVELLSRFSEDEATLNLAIMGLVDRSTDVRELAVSELVRRGDPRVVAQYREALRSGSDTILRRAAYGLGKLEAVEALPELIEVLTARRTRWVQMPVRTHLRGYPRVFHGSTEVFIGANARVTHHPQIGVLSYEDEIVNEWRYRRVTVFRTEVREALRSITGQDFGFERAEWQRWYQEHKR